MELAYDGYLDYGCGAHRRRRQDNLSLGLKHCLNAASSVSTDNKKAFGNPPILLGFQMPFTMTVVDS